MWIVLAPMAFVCLCVMLAAGLVMCAESPKRSRRYKSFLFVESVVNGNRKRRRLAAKRRAQFDPNRPVNVYPPANLKARPAAPAPRPRPPSGPSRAPSTVVKPTPTRKPKNDGVSRVPCPECNRSIALTATGKVHPHNAPESSLRCIGGGSRYVQYLIHEDPI